VKEAKSLTLPPQHRRCCTVDGCHSNRRVDSDASSNGKEFTIEVHERVVTVHAGSDKWCRSISNSGSHCNLKIFVDKFTNTFVKFSTQFLY
jgi:hypothetical protein